MRNKCIPINYYKYQPVLSFSILVSTVTTMSLSKVKRNHTDRELKEKLKILNELDCGARGAELCRKYGIRASTLSTWKKNRSKLQDLTQAGKSPNTKRNRESIIPHVERALFIWLKNQRAKKHPPPISQALLIEKAQQ